VQFNGVSGGSKSSKIICNVSDANYGSGVKNYEDHISIYRSFGGPTNPIEIAYNRIRGGTSKTGSAITVGDLGGGWINVHDNIVVTVANNGIAVAGGDNIRIENNNVDNRGDNISSMTYNAFVVRRITPCSNITIKGNRGIARLWNWNERYGLTVSGYRHGPELCSNVDDKDNQFGDASLQTSIFEDEPELCK
jgi:hypothetical protein